MEARVLSHLVDPFNRGTKYYRPPETVKFGMAAPESDFFSLGVVLIESVTKKNPIAFLDEFRANEALSVDDFIHAHLQNVLEKVESSQTQAVIRELVHHSMNWRRKIADTLPHKSYLAGINWDLLNQGLSPVSIGRILDERLSSEREPPSKETKCEMELSMDSGSSGSASGGAEVVSRETANTFTLNPEASVFVPRQPSHTPSAAARPAAASSQGNFSQPLGAHSHFALNKKEDTQAQNSRPSGRMAVRPRERPGLNNSAKHQTQRFYQAYPRHRQGENQNTYRHLRPETNRFFRPENTRPVTEPTAAGPGGRKKRHGGRRQS